jgi:homocysteine S-methyltransferase
MEREVDRFMWKVDAGADFAVTQPVFDPEALARFLERVSPWPVPVLAGLWPLRSLRNAEFVANEIPGVVVPDAVLERMANAQARGDEAAAEEGILIAREILEAVRPLVRGVHVTAPGTDVASALRVLADEAQ